MEKPKIIEPFSHFRVIDTNGDHYMITEEALAFARSYHEFMSKSEEEKAGKVHRMLGVQVDLRTKKN